MCGGGLTLATTIFNTMVVHHHTILIATVRRPSAKIECGDLEQFLHRLVKRIGMQELFKPIAIHGKYGFTGIVGIVTSHIAFHYFEEDHTLHFDVYSCKPYDIDTLLKFIDEYWGIEHGEILFVDRETLFDVKRYSYSAGRLAEVR